MLRGNPTQMPVIRGSLWLDHSDLPITFSSRVISDVSPGCWGLYQVISWNPPEMATVQPHWATHSNWLSSCERKNSAYTPSEPLLFQHWPVASHPPALPNWGESGSTFLITSLMDWKAAFMFLQTHLFIMLNKSGSLGLSSRAKTLRLQPPQCLCWTCSNLSVFYWEPRSGPSIKERR